MKEPCESTSQGKHNCVAFLKFLVLCEFAALHVAFSDYGTGKFLNTLQFTCAVFFAFVFFLRRPQWAASKQFCSAGLLVTSGQSCGLVFRSRCQILEINSSAILSDLSLLLAFQKNINVKDPLLEALLLRSSHPNTTRELGLWDAAELPMQGFRVPGGHSRASLREGGSHWWDLGI